MHEILRQALLRKRVKLWIGLIRPYQEQSCIGPASAQRLFKLAS